MTDGERKEFERHKKLAEEQLNNMYYGSNRKNANEKIPMPSFLSPPKEIKRNDVEKKKNLSNNNHLKAGHQNKENSPPKQKNGLGNNILNLLNFKGLKMDNDRLIILAVCLLLSGETTDELLMLALIYIML